MPVSHSVICRVEAQAFSVVGLGYGDEGKGAVVDYLARTIPAIGVVIRCNGGSQAAHHVVSPMGISHCFSQFAAGLFAPQTESWLLDPLLVDPLAWEQEYQALLQYGIAHLAQRCWIDSACCLITPYHVYLNQITALLQGEQRDGTCGRGIYPAFVDQHTQDALVIADLANHAHLRRRLKKHRRQKLELMRQLLQTVPPTHPAWQLFQDACTPEIAEYLVTRYRHLVQSDCFQQADKMVLQQRLPTNQMVLFEGAQGSLLDKDYGFWPHVTPSNTTHRNARHLLATLAPDRPLQTIGVIRAYMSRHGQGVLVTEQATLDDAVQEAHNRNSGWQGKMRYGWFDAVAIRYAMAINGGVQRLVLTCLDQLAGLATLQIAIAYQLPPELIALAADYFVLKSTPNTAQIVDIRCPHPPTRHGQQQLTQLLLKAIPVYQEYPGFCLPPEPIQSWAQLPIPAQSYLAAIAEALGQPLAWITLKYQSQVYPLYPPEN